MNTYDNSGRNAITLSINFLRSKYFFYIYMFLNYILTKWTGVFDLHYLNALHVQLYHRAT
jgi:hypothetical protein